MILKECRNAWRRLWRRPGYAALSVAVLGIGLGVALFLFSLVHTLVLAPLPFPHAERLVALGELHRAGGGVGDTGIGIGDADSDQFLALRAGMSQVESMGAYQQAGMTLDAGQGASLYEAGRFTAGMMELLGARPLLGRGLQPGDEEPGAPRVAVIGEALWRHVFGGDPAVVGRSVRIGGAWTTVVGVLPASFGFPGNAEAWLPLALRPGDHDDVAVVARRAGAIGLEGLRRQLDAMQPALQRLLPEGAHRPPLVVKPFANSLVPEDMQRWVWLMFGAGALVLLLACVNVANLQAVHALRRQRELALRAALGAGRGRLMLGALIESALLGLAALAVALALTRYGNRWLVSTYADNQQLPSSYLHFGIDGGVVTAGLGMVLACVMLAGGLPAWRASRPRLTAALNDGGKGSGGAFVRVVRALVTVEVALTVMLLIGAGTFVHALERLLAEPLAGAGHASQILTARIALPAERYRDDARRIAFFHDLAERLARQPDVVAATAANTVPGAVLGSHESIAPPGQPEPEGGWARAQTGIVDQGFLAVYGVRLRQGRFFAATDLADSPAVAVVDSKLAQAMWPGRDAVGQSLRLWPGRSGERILRVVGVIEPLQLDSQMERSLPGLLLPLRQAEGQSPLQSMGIALRLHAGAGSALRLLIAQVHAQDDQAAVYGVNSQVRAIAIPRTGFTVLTEVFSLIGGIALALAAAGLYGVLSLSVAQRTRELGIRRAIGAGGAAILRDVGRPLAWQLGLGLAAGVLLALPWSRMLADQGMDTRAHDPLVFGSAVALVVAVSIVAVAGPLWRALRIEPLVALRDE